MSDLSYDLEGFFEMMGHDQAEIEIMLNLFFNLSVEVLGEMTEAVSNKNWKHTGDLAHKIKSSLRMFSLDQLVQEAIEIERNGREGKNLEDLEIKVLSFKTKVLAVIAQMKDDIAK
jgi:HPt (histidine-containing phosphotransfer) domain-containing protein